MKEINSELPNLAPEYIGEYISNDPINFQEFGLGGYKTRHFFRDMTQEKIKSRKYYSAFSIQEFIETKKAQ
jgi:hypothetical protein